MKQCATPPRVRSRASGASAATKSACASRSCRNTGFAARGRELELRPERAPLRVARREIAEVVETAFADGDDLRVREQRARAPRSCERRSPRRGEGARRPSRTGRRGARPRARALARCPSRMRRSTIARRTPAAAARASTSARSRSKLSCVKFAPMSTRSSIGADCDDGRRGGQRGPVDYAARWL